MTLILERVSHRYGATLAVDDASLAVAAGEVVCLFGPSGCGKTTLLRLAAGLETLQSGRVSVAGTTVAEGGHATPPEKRPVGFVFQDFVLFPHLSAIDNVAFGLAGPDRREKARAELAAVGLEALGRRYPHQLSGGQQQRVALARAFARRPLAMLLDEPFAAIDAVLRRRLRADLRSLLKREGAATLLVTHDPEEAIVLADRIAVMAAGQIIETATPEQLFRTPRTVAGAGLFPSAQRLNGEVRSGIFRCAFGQASAPGLADGPAVAIAHEGGVTAAEDRSGAARIVDCRFRGPGWIATVEAGGETGTVPMLTAVAPGAAVATVLHAANLRLFPAGD